MLSPEAPLTIKGLDIWAVYMLMAHLINFWMKIGILLCASFVCLLQQDAFPVENIPINKLIDFQKGAFPPSLKIVEVYANYAQAEDDQFHPREALFWFRSLLSDNLLQKYKFIFSMHKTRLFLINWGIGYRFTIVVAGISHRWYCVGTSSFSGTSNLNWRLPEFETIVLFWLECSSWMSRLRHGRKY